MTFNAGDVVTVDFPLSERDWKGVCTCVKLSFDQLILEN